MHHCARSYILVSKLPPAMIDSIDRILQQYEISHYGFLPVEEPLSHLPDEYYGPWESLIAQLPGLIRNRQFYQKIAELPVLNTQRLHSIPEWRRAYVILTFFTHAHIWSDSVPHEVRISIFPLGAKCADYCCRSFHLTLQFPSLPSQIN